MNPGDFSVSMFWLCLEDLEETQEEPELGGSPDEDERTATV